MVHKIEEQVGLALEQVLLLARHTSRLLVLLVIEHGQVHTLFFFHSQLHSVHAVEKTHHFLGHRFLLENQTVWLHSVGLISQETLCPLQQGLHCHLRHQHVVQQGGQDGNVQFFGRAHHWRGVSRWFQAHLCLRD